MLEGEQVGQVKFIQESTQTDPDTQLTASGSSITGDNVAETNDTPAPYTSAITKIGVVDTVLVSAHPSKVDGALKILDLFVDGELLKRCL